MLVSLTPLKSAVGSLPEKLTMLVQLIMLGAVTAHVLGDDFSLPMDSPVGPTGFVPAAVLLLLTIRSSLQAIR